MKILALLIGIFFSTPAFAVVNEMEDRFCDGRDVVSVLKMENKVNTWLYTCDGGRRFELPSEISTE